MFTEERRLLDSFGIVPVTAGLHLCNASLPPTRMVPPPLFYNSLLPGSQLPLNNAIRHHRGKEPRTYYVREFSVDVIQLPKTSEK